MLKHDDVHIDASLASIVALLLRTGGMTDLYKFYKLDLCALRIGRIWEVFGPVFFQYLRCCFLGLKVCPVVSSSDVEVVPMFCPSAHKRRVHKQTAENFQETAAGTVAAAQTLTCAFPFDSRALDKARA